MAEIGFDMTVEGLRSYIGKKGIDRQYALVECAIKAYRRQLENWWPDALLIKCNAMGKDDHGKRQCLVAFLRNPASGGFASEALI